MRHGLTVADRIVDFYVTGIQDCDNIFDGDDVPSADELREGWEYSHAGTLWEDDVPYTEMLREAWVRGWLDRASAHMAREAARRAQEAADEG